MIQRTVRLLARVIRRRVLPSGPNGDQRVLVYYPPFRHKKDLVSHYSRARWYIPQARVAGQVFFGKAFSGVWVWSESDVPEYMSRTPYPNAHLKLVNLAEYVKWLLLSTHVLLWQGDEPDLMLRVLRLFTAADITIVTTDSLKAVEYGRYCDFAWAKLMSKEQRDELIHESFERFKHYTRGFRDAYQAACVFGTGPSIDTAANFDFAEVMCVVCNSVVQNRQLLDQIRPRFITAGDVVSHFGISLYADQFRNDLVKCLKERDVYFLTTASFALLLVDHYPEVRDKVMLLTQKGSRHANFDLYSDYSLPMMDSTLNIHMLPLAATFCDTIYILGCDGKNPDASKNEDFWAHSQSAQYHDLVETGHLCHPTFDVNRKARTYNAYQDSTKQTLDDGERLHGKRYYSLAPSFIPEINVRRVDFTAEQIPVRLHALVSADDQRPLPRG